MSEIRQLQEEIGAWADSVFPDRTIESAALKLYEEIGEMLRNPKDAGEHADIYIMMFDLSRMYGVDIASAIRDKMQKNRRRRWERTDIGTLHHTSEDAAPEFSKWDAYQMGAADFKASREPQYHLLFGEHIHYYSKGYHDAQHENEGSDLD